MNEPAATGDGESEADAAGDSRLGPAQRAAWLDELSGGHGDGRVDVVVIGGGVTGAGCALDLALRGHSVALLEQRDLASGTSSRSSKLIHGGLRYLQRLEFGLVKESLTERRLLLGRLAPHLVRPVQFLYPIRRGWRERLRTGLGIALYSAMAGRGSTPMARTGTSASAAPIAWHLASTPMSCVAPSPIGTARPTTPGW